jgi:hypothetical protein
MRSKLILLSVVLLLTTSRAWAASNDSEIIKEHEEKIKKLEKEIEELKKIIMEQAKTAQPAKAEPNSVRPAAQPVKPELNSVKPAAPQLTEEDTKKILAMLEKDKTQKKSVWSDLDIQLYGYLKFDASYDSAQTTAGNYNVWVDKNGSEDEQFNTTAKETRLGMRINGPEDPLMKTSGRVEIDFYGSGAEENKARIQMRHAYLQIDWPQDHFSILAGQTSDVISPLNPTTLNYTVLWDVGNIGYRRPQLRLTKDFLFEDDVDLKLEGAFVRTIGDDEINTHAGEDSGFPTLESRVSLMFPWFGYKPTTVGFSGHWGQEEYSSKDLNTWSMNLDVTQPVNKWFSVKGEAFTGENLDTYFGGIGQGVRNTGTTASPHYDKAIGSKGGWIAGAFGPWGKWRFNIGGGVDDVDSDDVITGSRILNRTIFGNAIYALNKNIDAGLELSHWRTKYKGPGDAEDYRVQTSLMYKF